MYTFDKKHVYFHLETKVDKKFRIKKRFSGKIIKKVFLRQKIAFDLRLEKN